jgi:hypothetical protein
MGSRHQGKAVNTDDLVTGHDTLSLSIRTFIYGGYKMSNSMLHASTETEAISLVVMLSL